LTVFSETGVARIKIGDNVGEWIESLFGTSAGTSLGPLLFIAHVHDVPKIITPKFADDMVALAVGTDVSQIEGSLQNATDQLVAWADKEGMELNAQKTKVMLFGDSVNQVNVKINDNILDCVTSYKYLGVILDTQMDFAMQVDYAVGKAKRAMAKVGTLIDDRKGIPIHTGIDLYRRDYLSGILLSCKVLPRRTCKATGPNLGHGPNVGHSLIIRVLLTTSVATGYI